MHDIKTFLANLPHHPGVYQMLDEQGKILYVGKAKDLKKRLASYFSNTLKDIKTTALVKQIKNIDFTVTTTENEAVLLECNLIKTHKPYYNVLLRDDKSYPYILITNQDEFPRIDIYRGMRKKNGLYFGPYPSSLAVRETISLLQKIFRIRTCINSYFKARSRPCLLYQIGRCSGPCVHLIEKEEYAKNIELAILFLEGKSHAVVEVLQQRMEAASKAHQYELAADYRDQIDRLRQIQDKQYVNVTEGNADVIGYTMQAGAVCIQLLSIRHGQVLGSRSYFPTVPEYSSDEEVLTAFLTQHYFNHPSHMESIPREIIIDRAIPECALLENVLLQQAGHAVKIIKPLRGKRKKWLGMATTSATRSLTAHLYTKSHMDERIKALQALLSLKKLPRRIECFDISHSMGEATVAACVVFDQNGPLKSDYRRFNIAGITPGDDVAAMHQAVLRRFKHVLKEPSKAPNVVLIDGGKTQLAAARQVVAELNLTGICFVGVAKGPERKAGFETLHIDDRAPIHLPADSLALHFIQHVRDEAHRFAITAHRQRRDKTRRQSTLEFIPGVGAKRRRDLLRYFGGIQGIAHASLSELLKVKGINRSIAERIFAAFHDTTV